MMAEHNQQFDTFNQWVSRASQWLTRRGEYERAVCVDAKGRYCSIGKQFMAARDEGAFPVRWFWPGEVVEASHTDELRKAAEGARDTFIICASTHTKKGTTVGDEKARRNMDEAAKLTQALAKPLPKSPEGT